MPDRNEHKALGLVSIAACAVLWSTAGIFMKVIPWNPVAITGFRSLIAGIFLFAVLKKPHFHWSFPQVAAGLLNVATMSLFVYANKNTTAANAILLQYGAPVFTAIGSIFILKEKPKIEQLGAFPFVLLGMALFFLDSAGGGTFSGNLAAALSSVSFGIYFVFMRMQKDGSPLESILLSHAITAAIMLPASLFFPLPAMTPMAVGAILGLGLLQIGLASVFFSYGIKRVTAVQGVLVSGIEPILNPVWVFLLTRETPGINAIAGGVIIIAAVTVSSVIQARRNTGNSA